MTNDPAAPTPLLAELPTRVISLPIPFAESPEYSLTSPLSELVDPEKTRMLPASPNKVEPVSILMEPEFKGENPLEIESEPPDPTVEPPLTISILLPPLSLTSEIPAMRDTDPAEIDDAFSNFREDEPDNSSNEP